VNQGAKDEPVPVQVRGRARGCGEGGRLATCAVHPAAAFTLLPPSPRCLPYSPAQLIMAPPRPPPFCLPTFLPPHAHTQFIMATLNDDNRKPSTGMWDFLVSNANKGVAPDLRWVRHRAVHNTA